MKIAVQCDFDGTVTVEEVSNLLLYEFTDGDWRKIVDDFYKGRMTVIECMERCFAMIKADKNAMIDFILQNDHIKIRPGFQDFHKYCREKDLYFVIVSNGIKFYIDAIMKNMGLNDVEVNAAENEFTPEGMRITYNCPGMNKKETDFKESYTRLFVKQGYNVICIGDSVSDIFTARRASHVFATDALRRHCREEGLDYIPFDTFYDVIEGLEKIIIRN